MDGKEEDAPSVDLIPIRSEEEYRCIFCDHSVQRNEDISVGLHPRIYKPAYSGLTDCGKKMLEHLLVSHHFVLADADKIPYLPGYLTFWREQYKGKNVEEYATSILTRDKGDEQMYYLLGDVLPLDRQIRTRLRNERLDYLLKKSQEERSEQHFSRKCLFCRKWLGNREEYFSHMLQTHSFNIGRPDNLVNVHLLLNVLQSKLNSCICIFCEKKFVDWDTLKLHMRKKRHLRIDAQNKEYDPFYIINYLEDGKDWQLMQSDEDDDADEELTNGSGDVQADWDDLDDREETESEQVHCLFCSGLYHSTDDVLHHMLMQHQFDLLQLKAKMKLDFYGCIRVINYIREQVKQKKTITAVLDRMHYGMTIGDSIPKRFVCNMHNRYLIPSIKGDPLLHTVEGLEIEGEEEGGVVVHGEELDLESLSSNRSLLMECR
ncbi:zinc finger protein [Planoprotostelium fungivorum]|uniref:type I protein arginine methyltransferase n=1 Tax=Planoprotostelium fungivorum TaxID=1890364 RepID=A0A2P6MNC6_9EUKA|nr:zinc finger protein [Planoprotostelium fungivorum]